MVAAPELVLYAERGIAGRIVDTDGAPIEGATVALRGGGIRDLGDLVLQPAQRIRGRVVDGEGQPVAGTQVTVEAVGLAMPLDVGPALTRPEPLVADADGRFEVDGLMVSEVVSLVARRDGATSGQITTFSSADPEPVELVLRALSRLAGRVVRPDGTPAAGVRVGNYYGGSGPEPTRTDEHGRFALEGLEPRHLYLVARQEGFAPSSLLEIAVEPGTVRTDLELRLRTAHTLSGRVLVPSGEPVAGARLAVPPVISLGQTDQDGGFRFTDQPPGPMEIEVRHGDGFPSRHEIEVAPEMAPVEIVLPATVIAGTVRFTDGSPAPGLTVRPYRQGESPVYGIQFDTVSAADGSFRLRGFPDGAYGLRVTGRGVAPDGWLLPEAVVIEGGESVDDLELVLPER